MSDSSVIERQLAGTFAALAESVPEAPSMTWADAKRLRAQISLDSPELPARPSIFRGKSGRTLLSIGIVLSLAGAGTAAAAASGAFDGRATRVFQGFASIPAPASWGYLPGFDSKKEMLEITNAGPEGTTVSLWSYQETQDLICEAIVESNPGQATFPGKPGTGVAGGCSGSIPSSSTTLPSPTPPPPTNNQTYGADAGIWRSPKGALYYLVGGPTPPGATRLRLTFPDGSSETVRAKNGWFATVISQVRFAGGYTGVFFGSDGKQIPGNEAR
jgi:hypothetical protein